MKKTYETPSIHAEYLMVQDVLLASVSDNQNDFFAINGGLE